MSRLLNSTHFILIAFVASACSGSASQRDMTSLRLACETGTTWNGSACVPWGSGQKTLERGQTQLAEGQLDAALASFANAVTQGPHRHDAHVRIFAQLGIAHGYKDDTAGAIDAFSRLLMIDPGHVLSYNEPPEATLKFETARAGLAEKPAPSIDVSLPVDTDVGKPIAIGIAVVADPPKLLKSATLYVRDSKNGPTRAADFDLPAAGERREVVLPPLGGNEPKTLALSLVARDSSGSEVLLWANRERPRSLQIDYTPPTPLYKKPWFLATVASVLIVSVGTTVYLLTRDPPEDLDGRFNPPN